MSEVDVATPVAIVGATATGKSGVAMALADAEPRFEIVSIDSMQVYRGMDIGTAKATRAEQQRVRHHLIDICEPSVDMSIVEFATAYDDAVAGIVARGGIPLLVGGTGLYLRAVVDRLTPPPRYPEIVEDLEQEPTNEQLHERLASLDPSAAAKMEPSNRRRVLRALSVTIGSGTPFSSFGPGLDHYPDIDVRIIGIDTDRAILDRRIIERYEQQIDAGFVAEVAALLSAVGGLSRTASQALGYKELARYVRGESSLDDALALAVTRTRRFARRQQRWFRRDPRIEWFEHGGDPAVVVSRVRSALAAAENSV